MIGKKIKQRSLRLNFNLFIAVLTKHVQIKSNPYEFFRFRYREPSVASVAYSVVILQIKIVCGNRAL